MLKSKEWIVVFCSVGPSSAAVNKLLFFYSDHFNYMVLLL